MDRPFGAWLPDVADYEGPGLKTVTNAVPLDDGNYGPWGDLATISDAVGETVVGLVSAKNTGGSVRVFAGSATDLYELDGSSWTSVGKAGGYGLSAQETWSFTKFGNFLIAASDLGEELQYISLVNGTQFADLSATAPRARYIKTMANFVMAGNTYDGTDGNQPDRVWWSAIGDPTGVWTPAAATQAGRQTLADTGWVQALTAGTGGATGVAYTEEGVWRIDYEGPPTVFRFDLVENARGVYIGSSVVSVGAVDFYWARDGIYSFDGANSTPISAGKWGEFLLSDLDDVNRDRMWATVDSDRHLIYWAYPGSGNTDGVPNRIFVYNYTTGNGSLVESDVVALMTLQSPGYTLEQLDAFGTLDELGPSLDSRVWAGGSTYLGAINSSGQLCQFTGSNLQADFVSHDFGGDRMFVTGVKANVDTGSLTVAVARRAAIDDSMTVGSYIAPTADRYSPQRAAGRYFDVRTRVAAGASWTKAQGFDLRAKMEGAR